LDATHPIPEVLNANLQSNIDGQDIDNHQMQRSGGRWKIAVESIVVIR
jgi:hypothetical protein